jgi:SAM-dependent methyltransferase
MSDIAAQAFAGNRSLWDEMARAHRRDAAGFYGVEAFIAGADGLGAIEAAEIGDVAGLRIAHLQCHFGMDSIRLWRRGARVTGLDFSSTAIAEARALADHMQAPVEFVHANVYDARAHLSGDFDMVYTSWGTVVWLPDLMGWARVVASLLKPGGWLYFLDDHPMASCLELDEGRLVLAQDWRTPQGRPLVAEIDGSYSGDPISPRTGYEWIHSLPEMLTALIAAGLRLDWVHEHEAVAWRRFKGMERGEDGLYRLPEGHPRLPLALSLRASRPPA